MYIVYVLKSGLDSKCYYGLTRDLAKRLIDHNSGKVRSTKARRPFSVVYSEEVSTREIARKREKYFKSGFGRKFLKNKLG